MLSARTRTAKLPVCLRNFSYALDLTHTDLECTTLAEQNSAAISICGSTFTGTSCADVTNFANQIQQTCQEGAGGDNLAGGTYTINGGLRVVVIHS